MEIQDVVLREKRVDLEPPAQAPKKARRVVFVVDDEAMVAEVVSVVLAMEGFETRVFTSPVDAWEAFLSASEKPSVLITDYWMYPYDGLELIARCREAHPELRTVLYSGNVGSEAIQKMAMKPDAFLSKPFLPRELIQTVAAAAGE
jgi:two-component system response regulator MtrA